MQVYTVHFQEVYTVHFQEVYTVHFQEVYTVHFQEVYTVHFQEVYTVHFQEVYTVHFQEVYTVHYILYILTTDHLCQKKVVAKHGGHKTQVLLYNFAVKHNLQFSIFLRQKIDVVLKLQYTS